MKIKKKKLIRSKNNEEPNLTPFSDVVLASDKLYRKSATGNLFKLGKISIHWITEKKNCIVLYSAEAEYVSSVSAAQGLLNLLKSLNLTK